MRFVASGQIFCPLTLPFVIARELVAFLLDISKKREKAKVRFLQSKMMVTGDFAVKKVGKQHGKGVYFESTVRTSHFIKNIDR